MVNQVGFDWQLKLVLKYVRVAGKCVDLRKSRLMLNNSDFPKGWSMQI